MNVNFNPISFSNINSVQNTRFSPLAPLKFDTVEFTGKKEKPLSKNVQEGVDFGYEVYNRAKTGKTDLKSLEELVHQKRPEITVMSSSELKKYDPNWHLYEAMYKSNITDDYTVENPQLFFKTRKAGDFIENMLFTTTAAHEYTHACQDDDKKLVNFVKEKCQNNPAGKNAFVGVGEAIFEIFNNYIQAYSTKGVFERTITRGDMARYGQIIPKKADVSKADLWKSLGLKNEEEYTEFINIQFDKSCFGALKQLSEQNPEMLDLIPDIDDLDKVRDNFKQYCALKSETEQEAYMTESVLAHKLTGKKSLNIDIFPIYYKTLGEILTKSDK